MIKAKFDLGQLVGTRGALDTISAVDIENALKRYVQGDWGDMVEEDKQQNEEGLKHGGRLMGVYKDSNGVDFWIITEWDRSVTTVLLPSEY